MTILTISLLLMLALVGVAMVRRVPEGQVYSLHRRGKPARLLQAGTHLVWPFFERVAHKIDLAGQMLRIDKVTTAAADMRGVVYWQVLEPERADAVFEEVDQLIRRGAEQVLRAEEQVDPADRRDLGARVKQALNEALRDRGMMVTRVELDRVR